MTFILILFCGTAPFKTARGAGAGRFSEGRSIVGEETVAVFGDDKEKYGDVDHANQTERQQQNVFRPAHRNDHGFPP